MTNDEVEAALVTAIRDCLQASGKPTAAVMPEVIPLSDLEGFDSLCAVEVLVQIEAQFGLRAEIETFFNGEGRNAKKRTIREIAAAINQ
jgi:acyl carrier protein